MVTKRNSNNQIEHVKIGRFAATIEFLSRIYLIPIDIDYKRKYFNFSFFNCKSFVYFILTSVPFYLFVGYISYQPGYFGELVKALQEVYVTSDIIVMIIFPGFNFTPMASIFVLLSLTSFNSVKEVILNPRFSITNCKYSILIFILLQMCGMFLILFGNFLALINTVYLRKVYYSKYHHTHI